MKIDGVAAGGRMPAVFPTRVASHSFRRTFRAHAKMDSRSGRTAVETANAAARHYGAKLEILKDGFFCFASTLGHV